MTWKPLGGMNYVKTNRPSVCFEEVVKVTFMPYPHQEAGIDWIVDKRSAALLWGMG